MRRAAALPLVVALSLVPTMASAGWNRTATATASWSTATVGSSTLSLSCSGALGGGTVGLTWTAAANATGYTINRTGGLGGPTSFTSATTSFTDTIPILSLATTFSYTVKGTVGGWTGPVSTTRTSAFSVLGCVLG